MKLANSQRKESPVSSLPISSTVGNRKSVSSASPNIKSKLPQKNEDQSGINQANTKGSTSHLIHLKKTNSDNSADTSRKHPKNLPPVPNLNLSLAPHQSQTVNLDRLGTISQTSEMNINSKRPFIPGLNIEGLDLTDYPPHSSKIEHHPVLICLHYKKQMEVEKEDLAELFEKDFNQNVRLNEINEYLVIEASDNDDSEKNNIPTIQSIDLAFQNLDHLSFLIKQTNSESSHLTNVIDETLSEITQLRDKKESLKIENALIRERINVGNSDLKKFARTAEQMKKDFDSFISKIQGI